MNERFSGERSGLSPTAIIFLTLVVLACLTGNRLTAQVVWTEAAGAMPSSRQPSAMAFDSKRGVTVFFGGWAGNTLRDTWEWDGAKWKRVSKSGPSPRRSSGMAYDGKREVTVLFGGFVCGEGCAEFAGDTWEWNGKKWKRVATKGPSPRRAYMAYDSAREVTVLFGGNNTDDSTWEWNGKKWSEVSTTGPPPREDAELAYDSRREVTVMFGGSNSQRFWNDTWEWNGKKWRQVSTSGPQPMWGHAMAYDSRRGVTVLYGGHTGRDRPEEDFDDTWEWNGKKWSKVKSIGPPARKLHAMAYDSARGQMVMFGGRADAVDSDISDTWLLRTGVAAAYSDYDGDGVSDLAVYNPKSARWRVKGGSGFKFGAKGVIPVPADYDGKGKAKAAYFQATNGVWKVRKGFKVKDFGQDGDIPAPGDYDGDGETDVAFFRPSTGTWHFAFAADMRAAGTAAQGSKQSSSALPTEEVEFGRLGDVPVPGDYDGDGDTDLAVYRPAKGLWDIRKQKKLKYGKIGGIPVPADYDGDGKTDIAIWTPKTGQWDVRQVGKVKFGALGNIPVPGDFDGDGAADFAVYDPATGTWSVKDQFESRHGKPGELPLVQGR